MGNYILLFLTFIYFLITTFLYKKFSIDQCLKFSAIKIILTALVTYIFLYSDKLQVPDMFGLIIGILLTSFMGIIGGLSITFKKVFFYPWLVSSLVSIVFLAFFYGFLFIVSSASGIIIGYLLFKKYFS